MRNEIKRFLICFKLNENVSQFIQLYMYTQKLNKNMLEEELNYRLCIIQYDDDDMSMSVSNRLKINKPIDIITVNIEEEEEKIIDFIQNKYISTLQHLLFILLLFFFSFLLKCINESENVSENELNKKKNVI
jgi:hypothetical protein